MPDGTEAHTFALLEAMAGCTSSTTTTRTRGAGARVGRVANPGFVVKSA